MRKIVSFIPHPSSRIEAAKNYGIDWTLLLEQLRLTPAGRARKLELASTALERVRGVARSDPGALRRGRRFVVIGGLVATFHGSTQMTYVLDICYSRASDNLRRLASALAPFHPKLRGLPATANGYRWDRSPSRDRGFRPF